MIAKVLVVMGSKSDLEDLKPCFRTLDELKVPYEARVSSAHRTPEDTAQLSKKARDRGIRVIIAAAGGAAHLAGAMAASTTLPVLAVPIVKGGLGGLDSLLSSVQMPPGVPVASVGMMGGPANAALFAAQIIATEDRDLAQTLADRRAAQAEKVRAADRELGDSIKK